MRVHTDGFLSTELRDDAPLCDLESIKYGCKILEPEEFYKPLEHFAQYGVSMFSSFFPSWYRGIFLMSTCSAHV